MRGARGTAESSTHNRWNAEVTRLSDEIVTSDEMSPLMHLSVEQFRARGHQSNRKRRPNPTLRSDPQVKLTPNCFKSL